MCRWFLVIIVLVTVVITKKVYAIDDAWTMTPENFKTYTDMQTESDRYMLEAIKELNRQSEQREQNPYGRCISMGEVEGVNRAEVDSLARQLGANRIRYILTTTTKVRAVAYKCPSN